MELRKECLEKSSFSRILSLSYPLLTSSQERNNQKLHHPSGRVQPAFPTACPRRSVLPIDGAAIHRAPFSMAPIHVSPRTTDTQHIKHSIEKQTVSYPGLDKQPRSGSRKLPTIAHSSSVQDATRSLVSAKISFKPYLRQTEQHLLYRLEQI